MKLLIVEDETELLGSITSYLLKERFICETATDYKMAAEKIHLYDYDVVLLDLTLPYGNGLDLLHILKEQHTETGVIIISARDSLDDRIKGLDLGADDYLTKPFHLSELNSRIRAVLRRRKYKGSDKLIFNEISINTQNAEVKISKQLLNLTKKEYELLLFFMSNHDRILSKEAIAVHLWGDEFDMAGNYDFIYTHLNNLRRKIRKAGGTDYIHTMYGIGYKFCEL